MLSIPGNARLFLCRHPMSMRKSFDGLMAEIEKLFPGELLTGAFFIFLNRRKDHMKVLFWDQDGFVIYFKRLEQGTFCCKEKDVVLNRRAFLMLLEGITPKRLQARFAL